MRIALYARYSSELQKDRSIEDQFALLRQFAQRQGWHIVETFEDRAQSGSSMIGRDGIFSMMQRAKAHSFDAVLVESLDRLSRDVGDLDSLFKRLTHWGVRIETMHEGTTDRLKVGIRGIVGAVYLQDLAQKVRRGMAGQAREGKVVGGRAYGYRAVPGKPGEMQIIEAEADIVRRIFAEYIAGRSPKMIAHGLNAESVPAPRGTLWKGNSILGDSDRAYGILRNEIYIGQPIWNKVSYRHDPDTSQRSYVVNPREDWIFGPRSERLRIVDDATFEAAAKMIERHSRKPPGAAKRSKHLLSGLLKCGVCGQSFISKGTYKNGVRVECSTSRESGSCSHNRTYYLEAITKLVFEGLSDRLRSPEAIRIYLEEYRAERQRLAEKEGRDRDKLARQLGSIENQLVRLVDSIAEGHVHWRAVAGKMDTLEADKLRLTRELEAIPAQVNVVELHPAAVERYIGHLNTLSAGIAKGQAGEEDRLLIRELIEKIIIHPTEPGQLDIEILGKLSVLLGDEALPPTARLRGGFVGAGEGTRTPTTFVTGT